MLMAETAVGVGGWGGVGGMGWGNGEGRRDEMEYVCGSLVEQCCWQVVNCIRDADVLASASGMAGCLVFCIIINIDSAENFELDAMSIVLMWDD